MDEQSHRAAMARVDEAQAALASGQSKKARDLLAAAAALEEQCADRVAPDRSRTRGILCVSAVSLWREAGELARAGALARRYLREGLTAGFAREVHELLGRIDDELAALERLPQVDGARAASLLEALERLEEQLAAGVVPRVTIDLAA